MIDYVKKFIEELGFVVYCRTWFSVTLAKGSKTIRFEKDGVGIHDIVFRKEFGKEPEFYGNIDCYSLEKIFNIFKEGKELGIRTELLPF